MKVKLTFIIKEKDLNSILNQIGSKELKDRLQSSLEYKFATLSSNQRPKISSLKLEVSK